MGRGRGRGRKPIANGRSHEDKMSSGEEVVPARKRRGRPQKQRAPDKVDLAEPKNSAAGVHGDAEGDDAKLKENDDPEGNGNKRNRAPKEESSNLDMEENSSSTRSSNDESTTTTRSSGFRQNGSRRKSTPRRAAEAGL
ncbi:hypothetical protein CFC21_108681 [Triticum aestivum]|uniref:Uncharacterized protein n=3 Tax=Triticinae TaxID=1648030 RepID=A0A453RF28_AEGTS|nr:uncharacterized protein LOC109733551 [Aegilops tauschii subsp. strangulata]XP_044442697.1 uncharacterized protein LOC123168900 [Triticum aestivum]KAF7108155.1 hypothetical protein CFC21_108681 [Triticum aestivum]